MSSLLPSPNESRIPQILIGTILPTVLSSIFVAARLYTRGILIKTWGLDDTFITIAWLCGIGTVTILGIQTKMGLGHHSNYQNPSDTRPFLISGFVERILYQTVLWFSKMGLCVFYRRVFEDKRSIRYINWTICFVVISQTAVLVLAVFECTPIEDNWSVKFAELRDHCLPFHIQVWVSAASNITADIVLIAFAVPRVLPLIIPRSQKIFLLIVASLGILVIIAATIRLIEVLTFPHGDPLWDAGQSSTWSSVEMQTGLFCISAPCVRPLLGRMCPGFISSTLSGKTGHPKTRSKIKANIDLNTVPFPRSSSYGESVIRTSEDFKLNKASRSPINLHQPENSDHRRHNYDLEAGVSRLSVSVTQTISEENLIQISSANVAAKYEHI